MKKLLSLVIAITLLIGIAQVPGGVSAEEKPLISLKQAIEIAKEALSLNTEGFEFNSSYNENFNGFNVWSLNWNNTKTNNESINVSIDASKGSIVSVGWYTPYEQPKSRIPKHTKAEAQKAAEQWAAKLQGERFKQTKLREIPNQDYYSKYSDVYSYEFVRVQDGIEVAQNTISIQLDKNTLKLRYFGMVWDNKTLPAKANAFSLEKAKEIFKSKLGIELTYNLIYGNSSNEPKAVLTYTLKNGNSPIDAISGELLSNMYRIYYGLDKGGAESTAAPAPITPQEQAELDKTSSYITKEDAVQVVKKYIKLDENMKLERANLYPGYQAVNAAWNLEFKNSDNENKTVKYLYAQVDAVTKEFKNLNISYSNENPKKNEAISKEQAMKLAEEFLGKVQPEKSKQVQIREVKDMYGIMPYYQNNYSFNFVRMENGIPCPSNSLFVRVDEYTGEVTSYNTNWTNISFPKPQNVISLDKAYEVLFNKVKFGMEYTYHYPNLNDYDKREIRLAYVLANTNVSIDANSGQMLDYDGTPIKSDEKLKYADIKGHKAEEAINVLIEMGIIVPEDTKFSPDNHILQKDFIKYLVSSLQEYYPMPAAKAESQYDSYYNEAIRRKLIAENEKNPDAVVTRQDAAKMIVRAMNYGVLAEKGKMFAANFKDASSIAPAFKGYVVIAAELGVISPVSSNINPTGRITRGDAAVMLLNYLKCDTSL